VCRDNAIKAFGLDLPLSSSSERSPVAA
jgi:hypothetical protein